MVNKTLGASRSHVDEEFLRMRTRRLAHAHISSADKEFWPEHIKCREWLRAPPTGQQAGFSQHVSTCVREQSLGSTSGEDEKSTNQI